MDAMNPAGQRQLQGLASDGSAPVIDLPDTLRRLGGDFEFFIDFVGIYFEDQPPLLEAVRGAIADQDSDRLHRGPQFEGPCSEFRG